MEALKLADEAVADQARERMRQYPGMRFRVVRTLYAICTACGTRYTFHKDEQTLVIESPQTGSRSEVNK